MTERAITLVQNQELRDLLERNADSVKFGSWFPDWGQYIGHPFADLSHRADPFLFAFLDYLSGPEVRYAEDYPRLVALFMGAAAHIIQDQYYDTLFLETLKRVDSGLSGDMEMGIINIARQGYLRLRIEPYLPEFDLAEVYRAAGGFDAVGVDSRTFSRDLRSGVRIQFLQLRALKLLSFLASGLMAREMPWGARSVMDAPGGIMDAARVTARFWEALWLQLSGMAPSLIVTSYPARRETLASEKSEDPFGRVTLVGSRPLVPEAFGPDAVLYIGGDGSVVPGMVTDRASASKEAKSPSGDYPGAEIFGADSEGALVVQCVPPAPLTPGRDYLLHIRPGGYGNRGERLVQAYRLPFRVPVDDPSAGRIGKPLDGRAGISHYYLGIFICILCLSIGSVLFGIPAYWTLARDAEIAARFREGGSPDVGFGLTWMIGAVVLRLFGGICMLTGGLMLITGGSPLLALIRMIF